MTMTHFDPFSFSSDRELLAHLLETVPEGDRIAATVVCRMLSTPELLQRLDLSPQECRAVENFVWSRRLD
jgi:hypothetical protein